MDGDATTGQMAAATGAPGKALRCAGCSDLVPETRFSRAQLKLKGKRRCGDCTASAPVARTQKAAAAPAETAGERQRKSEIACEALLRWLKQDPSNNLSSLAVHHCTPDFRGVTTASTIKRDAVFLSVSMRYLITTEQAKQKGAIYRALVASHFGGRHGAHSWVALYLLEEKRKGADSFYQPYLDILPASLERLSHLPLLFGRDSAEVKELQGSALLDAIAVSRSLMREEYEEIAQHMAEQEACGAATQAWWPGALLLPCGAAAQGPSAFERVFPFDDFLWARLIVQSRIFGIERAPEVKTEVMVPMADMLNHSDKCGTFWYFDQEKQSFEMCARKGFLVRKGARSRPGSSAAAPGPTPVFDTYGKKCNAKFLQSYGFAMRDNDEQNQAAALFRLEGFENRGPEAAQWVRWFGDCNAFEDSSRLALACGWDCDAARLRAHKFQVKTTDMSFAGTQLALSFARLVSLPTTEEARLALRAAMVTARLGQMVDDDKKLEKDRSDREKLAQAVAGGTAAPPVPWSATPMADAKLLDSTLPDDMVAFSETIRVSPDSPQREIAALACLASACHASLAGFTTTLADDNALLSTGGAFGAMPFSVQQCVILRHGEKRVLRFWADLHDVVVAAWSAPGQPGQAPSFKRLRLAVAERSAALARVDGAPRDYTSYLESVWKPLLCKT